MPGSVLGSENRQFAQLLPVFYRSRMQTERWNFIWDVAPSSGFHLDSVSSNQTVILHCTNWAANNAVEQTRGKKQKVKFHYRDGNWTHSRSMWYGRSTCCSVSGCLGLTLVDRLHRIPERRIFHRKAILYTGKFRLGRNVYIHPYFERNSNPRRKCSKIANSKCFKPSGR
jgi:hypothetical protein